jgi:putative aminopeptidase FrvX
MPGNRDLDRLVPQLASAYGPPGREAGVRAVLMRALGRAGRRETDALGNLHLHVSGRGPKLLLAAHMDAPGVIVTRTEASGLARLTQLGGPAAPDLVGATVRFEDGTRAVVGCDRPKDGKEVEADALFLHPGLAPTAAKKRLPVGAVGGLDGGAERLGDMWCGVNLDDRAGCAALAAAMLHPGPAVRYDLHVVFTAQSEVGARGAATGTFGIEPDLAVAVDVAYAGDGAGAVAAGSGPCIGILELGYVPHPAVLDLARRAARLAKIKPQYLVREESGSDARTIRSSRSGVPTVVLAIPALRTGSPRLLVHRKDLEQTTLLLQRLLSTPWRA